MSAAGALLLGTDSITCRALKSPAVASLPHLSSNVPNTAQPQKKFPGAGPRAYRIRNTVCENWGACAGEVWAGAPRNRPVPVHKYRTTYQLDSPPNVK